MAIKSRQTKQTTFIRPAYGQFVTGYGDNLKELGNAIEGYITGVWMKESDNDDYEDTWEVSIVDFDGDRFQLSLMQDNFRSLKAINRLATVTDFTQPFFLSASKADRDNDSSPTNMGIRQMSWDNDLLPVAFEILRDDEEKKEGVNYGPPVPITGYVKRGKRQVAQRDWSKAQAFYNQVVETWIKPRIEKVKPQMVSILKALTEQGKDQESKTETVIETAVDENTGMHVSTEVEQKVNNNAALGLEAAHAEEVPGTDPLIPPVPPFEEGVEQTEYDDLPL